jgi:hypothetical protein
VLNHQFAEVDCREISLCAGKGLEFHSYSNSKLEHIISVQETSTCIYLVVVGSPRICSDAAFRPLEKEENSIECSTVGSSIDGVYSPEEFWWRYVKPGEKKVDVPESNPNPQTPIVSKMKAFTVDANGQVVQLPGVEKNKVFKQVLAQNGAVDENQDMIKKLMAERRYEVVELGAEQEDIIRQFMDGGEVDVGDAGINELLGGGDVDPAVADMFKRMFAGEDVDDELNVLSQKVVIEKEERKEEELVPEELD